jgi:hypothetical protein
VTTKSVGRDVPEWTNSVVHLAAGNPTHAQGILGLGNFSPLGAAHGTKRTLSKRTNPASVPIHKYPSLVCVIAWGVPRKKPSRIHQAVWAYWVMLRLGSRAKAQIEIKASEANMYGAPQQWRSSRADLNLLKRQRLYSTS